MQERDPAPVAQSSEGGLELECLGERLLHEPLDDLFPPGTQRPPPESSGKSLDARKSDALDLTRLSVEYPHPGIAEDPAHLRHLARFVVVVAEDRDDRDRDSGQDPRERPRLVGLAAVREISAQREHVRAFRYFGEERAKRYTLIRPPEMQVSDRGYPNPAFFLVIPPNQRRPPSWSGDLRHNA